MKASTIFFGTDEFAMIVLDALKRADFTIVAEITKPIPAKQLTLPPAELGVVAVYGKILPQRILEHFRYGVLNIHPSLLPKYRGPSPIRTAIANGDSETGVTIIRLNNEMDGGDIIAKQSLRIESDERHATLRDRLAQAGADLLVSVIPDYIAGKIQLQPQDNSQATFTKMLTRDDGKVDLQSDSAESIYNKFRAYEGWPGIWTLHKGKRVKILDCRLAGGILEILEVQPEGKKPMSLNAYANGYGSLPERRSG